jgi:hypothetical protein
MWCVPIVTSDQVHVSVRSVPRASPVSSPSHLASFERENSVDGLSSIASNAVEDDVFYDCSSEFPDVELFFFDCLPLLPPSSLIVDSSVPATVSGMVSLAGPRSEFCRGLLLTLFSSTALFWGS